MAKALDSSSDLLKQDAQVATIGLPPSRIRQRPWWQLGGKDYAFVSVDAGYTSSGNSSSTSLDIPDKAHNVWETTETHDIYAPIEHYEGAHRFDPELKWEPEEEKKLVRLLDWRIALPACIFFFALQLDRGNITQALNGGLLNDLGLNTNDYNAGMTIFYCSFLFAELPSQLISKKLGPDVWIPIQMVSWSIVAAAQYHLEGKTSFFITRFLLGLLEGGFIPDTILYLSYYYKHSELPVRLSWFWTSYQSTQVIGALLAAGILKLPGQPWRDLFAIEGALTALIGLGAWFYMPASPTQTARSNWRGLLRPKLGWFTERQEYILVTRVLLDDPNKATMHNRQGLSLRDMWKSILDYDMWPIYILGLTWGIPAAPPQAYITLSLKALGFTTFETSMLTIPAYTLFVLQLLFWTWGSEKANQRLLVGVITQLWFIPLLIALAVLPPVFNNSNWAKFAITTLIVGHPYPHAIIVSLTSRNSGNVRGRTVASSLYNITVQASTLIGQQIYRDDDKPYYYRGNRVLLGIAAWNLVAFILAKAYYVWRNNQRDKKWNNMTREERLEYLRTTKDVGNRRLDFRFAH